MSTVDEDSKPLNNSAKLARRVCDAGLLLDYALANGVDVDQQIIAAIRDIQLWLDGVMDETVPRIESKAESLQRLLIRFDEAYCELSLKMKTVSADTLRATNPANGRPFISFGTGLLRSEAEIWSFKMWMFTGFALIVIAVTEFLQEMTTRWYPLDPGFEKDWVYQMHLYQVGLDILLPFIYGLLGACLYLLPKCHVFVSSRTFNPLRIAEYKSRMLLGFASGGIVMFFVHEIAVGEGDEIVQLSAPVLAIIAGYNTDFIFQAIERMVAAILPKVGVASAMKAAPAAATVRAVSIEGLTDRLLSADNEEDRSAIRSLLEAARKRL
ncbi:MAG: hypothetical protein HN725_22150 [Alphaproteobacteria bacterium]|nr:hypothetical protein [Alphaproteobacteria bacterium]MBT4086308.1 hypothetical protein [Alphaproteobacteria bacterium]MBT6385245.1 hypothetical protein [Alphaproteobacteria bacterium]MBT7748005.1 hypothetical protein [Alphaproteobacteria bacterium]